MKPLPRNIKSSELQWRSLVAMEKVIDEGDLPKGYVVWIKEGSKVPPGWKLVVNRDYSETVS